jgi:hypothetical protein
MQANIARTIRSSSKFAENAEICIFNYMKNFKLGAIALVTILITVSVVLSCKRKKAESCTDGIQNQNEKAVDCGGPCNACPTCVDGIQNQDEIGVDCGGPCPACGTCTDGIQNHGETAIDCGGPCNACITCTDGIKNGDEVGIDCGGSHCPACNITYPPSGTYGANLLYGSDTVYSTGTGNSFKAIVPVGSTLKIEAYLISGPPWGFNVGSGNWNISPYTNNMQTFDVLNPGTYDVQMIKMPSPPGLGSFQLKFYENSATVTHTKVVIWQ